MSTRLQGSKYKTVFDHGRLEKGRLLVGWYYASPSASREAGVVVSKKVFHGAVDRNRAKRLMREAYRLLVKAEAVPEHVSWIFIARRAIQGQKVSDVMDEMKRLCRRMA